MDVARPIWSAVAQHRFFVVRGQVCREWKVASSRRAPNYFTLLNSTTSLVELPRDIATHLPSREKSKA